MTTKSKSPRKRISTTDGLSDLDMGESHGITDAEIEEILQEDLNPAIEKKDEKTVNPLQALSSYEFQVTMSVLPTAQNIKRLVDKLEEELPKNRSKKVATIVEEIKRMSFAAELGIWNSMASKFGYKSLEEAQENGMKLAVKSGHFVQAVDA